MNPGVAVDDNGLCHAERDASWEPEISREILSGILDVERRAVFANLICWGVVAAAAATLPNAGMYVLPLAFRLVAMAGTRAAFAKVRKCIAESKDYSCSLVLLGASLFVGGAAWGATLIPMVVEPFLNPGRLLVGGAVVAGLSIVVSLLMPVPRLAAAFSAGFVVVFCGALIWAPDQFAIKGAIGVVGLFAIFTSYGYATVARHRKAAELLVENRRLSEELAEALAHAEFLAYRDPLTGLPNRRAFFLHNEEPDRTELRHVLTIDLDHFKAINDTYGHPVGDRVLVGVGGALREVIESLDTKGHIAARIGGEEFAVILKVADPKLASLIAEMVRQTISVLALKLGRPNLITTASIGISEWRPGETLDKAVGRADSALYRAKARGRDCVVSARKAA